MTNYTKTTNFATKDTLPSGNANKIVKGTEIDTEFNNIATAVATKADTAGPTFTGTVTIPTVDLNGGAIDGTTVGASTAAAITGTTIVANTSINIAGDGATVTGIKDEDDMSSNSATKLATQQSIKAYVDSQITAQDLDFQADSGGALSIDLDSETLTFTGGTGVDTSGSGNAVTFAIDSTVATLTGTQTLTNKTLTSPTLNTPTIGTSFTIGSATITEAELEILDGATVTTAELNVLDGITSTTAELNILDGVTSTAAELNILDGVTATAAELNILDGVTSTAAELNILDGVTSTTAELNILDGVTATTAELNYVDGVTSAIQTQIDAKAPLASPTFTGTVTVPGLTTTADVSFGDNDKAIFGAGSDLQIYHNGSNSIITETGTGNLYLGGDNLLLTNGSLSAAYLEAITGGAVNIYHNGSTKLATTSTGIDVTGTVTADGAVIQSDGATVTVSSADYEVALLGRRGSSGVDLDKGFLRLKDTNTTKVVLDSAGDSYFNGGNVGIGTASPSEDLTIAGTKSGSSVTDAIIDFGILNSNGDSKKAQIKSIITSDVSSELIFSTTATHSFSEAMRIDASQNLLVSKTASSFNTAGAEIRTTGVVIGTVDGAAGLIANRLSSDGTLIQLSKDGTTVGSIGSSSPALYIGSGDVGVRFDGANDRIRPVGNSSNLEAIRDNAIDLGDSSARFDDIHATNGTIQTSDRNEKQDIEALSDAEQRVAVAAKGLLRKFRWISRVEENGDDARIHFGIIAQDLQAAFTAEGLDAGRYAMFISSTWTDEDTGEERTRLGVRYSELLAFIISAI